METVLKTVADQIVGFVDIGTNAVRLLVVRINPNLSYTMITQEKEVVRLGEGEFKDNKLRAEAMERAVFVCKRFVGLARIYGATNIIAVGTSATREARNRVEFLQKLLDETGLNVRVITGEEEARLIYVSVSNGIDLGDEKALLIDVGGGSTEIAIGNQHKCFYMDSLRIGAIRLTAQFVGEEWAGPIPNSVYKRIKKHVSNQMMAVKEKVTDYGIKSAWGTSGTIINLAEITNKMFKKTGHSKNLKLVKKNLSKLAPILCSLSLEERRKLPGINPERADIIVAGAAIIETLMEEFDLNEINISHKDLRDGLLVEYLSNFEGFKELQKKPVRSRSVLSLGRSCNFDEKHSETVALLALQLFDSAKQIGLHNLGESDRDLLRYAAMLHDVGDFLSFNDHHLHSHYIVSNAELLGFDENERAIIANAVRFHRKKLPTKKALKPLCLDDESKFVVVVLSTFLRFAEKLDRSHCGLVTEVQLNKTGKDRVLLSFFSNSDCSLEKWAISQNKQAFINAFGLQLYAQCTLASS